MSCPLRSVSEEKTRTSAGSQPSTSATSCRCTVVVPLPNSAVPTNAAYPPSGRSATRDRPGWPPGGMVSSIATAIPVPVAHPSGAARPRPLARAFSARSRQSETPIAGGGDVLRLAAAVDQVVALDDEVAAAQLDRVDAERAGQLVDRGLDREHGLREPVAAERPGRDRVGVDRAGVDPLVRAAVDGDRLLDRVEQHARPVVAVGAGVGGDVEREPGQRPVARSRPA